MKPTNKQKSKKVYSAMKKAGKTMATECGFYGHMKPSHPMFKMRPIKTTVR